MTFPATELYPNPSNASWGDDYFTVTITVKTSTSGNTTAIERVYLLGETIFALGKVTNYGHGEAMSESTTSLTVQLPPNTCVTKVNRYFIGANVIKTSGIVNVQNEAEFYRRVRGAIPANACIDKIIG